jgi:hypothetical protein
MRPFPAVLISPQYLKRIIGERPIVRGADPDRCEHRTAIHAVWIDEDRMKYDPERVARPSHAVYLRGGRLALPRSTARDTDKGIERRRQVPHDRATELNLWRDVLPPARQYG